MKKLQIILGENEAQITMDLAEQTAAELFKELSDKMFAAKYGIARFALGHGCCKEKQTEDISDIQECDDDGSNVEHSLVKECIDDSKTELCACEDSSSKLATLVNNSLDDMQRRKDFDNRMYHLPIDKKGILLAKCPDCNGKFFIKASKGEEMICKCGCKIDTDKMFIRGTYSCKKCANYFVFFADEKIGSHDIKCSDCGNRIKLKFDESRHEINNF